MIEASDNGCWEKLFRVHHLLFFDDTILFSELDVFAIKILFVVNDFEKASGLNVNHDKLEILGINSTQEVIESIACKYGCKMDHWLCTYLSLPLFDKPRILSFWNPIIEKIERRLKS